MSLFLIFSLLPAFTSPALQFPSSLRVVGGGRVASCCFILIISQAFHIWGGLWGFPPADTAFYTTARREPDRQSVRITHRFLHLRFPSIRKFFSFLFFFFQLSLAAAKSCWAAHSFSFFLIWVFSLWFLFPLVFSSSADFLFRKLWLKFELLLENQVVKVQRWWTLLSELNPDAWISVYQGLGW